MQEILSLIINGNGYNSKKKARQFVHVVKSEIS